jgi:hypothetical protein
MRKFVIHTRSLFGGKTNDLPIILEVEGEIITAMEDPSVLFLPEDEFKFCILKPETLYETKEIIHTDKYREKITVPPIYHSHSVYETKYQARVAAEKMIRHELQFVLRKQLYTSIGLESYTDQELQAKYEEIKEVLLA